MSPVPRTVQLALSAVAVLVALLLARVSWSLTTKMLVFFGVGAVITLVALRFERRLPRNGPERAGPDEVMPGARGYVDEFELAGFRRVGGFRWALRGRLVIETVLAAPHMDRYAIVTDRVLEVGSGFGECTLITTNSGRAPVPGGTLRQVVEPGDPAELLRAHQDALDRLAARSHVPHRFRDDDEILRVVRVAEERALRNTKVPSLIALLTKDEERDRELGDDAESRRRIDTWLQEGSAVVDA